MGRTDFKYSIWSKETSSPLIPFITFTPSYPILPFLLNSIEEEGKRKGNGYKGDEGTKCFFGPY